MTIWKGTKISSGIVIGDDTQAWATHYSVLGAGGLQEVADISSRNNIPTSTFLHPDGMGSGRRRNMMIVSVSDKGDGNSASYQFIIAEYNDLTDPDKLIALSDNDNWVEINFGSSGDFVTLNGTQTLTNKTLINPIINCAVGSAVSDQVGDVYYRDNAGEFTRLGIGTVGEAITSTGTLPQWSYTLKNSFGTTTLNWNTFDKWDSNGILSHDWSGRHLFKASSGAVQVLDYNLQILTEGNTVKLDWLNGLINDSSAILSIDSQNRKLYNTIGVVSLDWTANSLYNDWFFKNRLFIGIYGTFSETVSGAAYIQGNAIAADIVVPNTVTKTKADAGQFIRMRYDKGISFHTNLTGSIGTQYSDEDNERLLITNTGDLKIFYYILDNIDILTILPTDRQLSDATGTTVCDWSGTNASFEVKSTTKGFLSPRMTTVQKLAIASPMEGTEVFDLTLHQKSYFNGTLWVNY